MRALADDDTITHSGLVDFHDVLRCETSNGGVSDFTLAAHPHFGCTRDEKLD